MFRLESCFAAAGVAGCRLACKKSRLPSGCGSRSVIRPLGSLAAAPLLVPSLLGRSSCLSSDQPNRLRSTTSADSMAPCPVNGSGVEPTAEEFDSTSTGTASQGCVQAKAPAAIGPLHGVRVVDLSRILAGPYCTMNLGDLGADVVKIERPGRGDDTRSWGPPFINGESTYFLSVNRNKRSVEVDITSVEGRDQVLSLIRDSDVVVENYLPGKLNALGLGYEHAKAVNPRIIYASISGYGDTGPYANHPGYDVGIACMSGLVSITGHPDGPPAKVGVALTDILTGLNTLSAISAALYHRERTGVGQHIGCSLLESQMAALTNVASSVLNAGTDAKRWGTAHESIVPYQVFAVSDGDVLIAAMNDDQFSRLAKCLGHPEWSHDDRFSTNQARVSHRSEVIERVQNAVSGLSREHVLGLLHEHNVTATPVNTVKEAFNDPQVRHRGMVAEMIHPSAGRIRTAGIPIRFSESPASIRLAPPRLGQHTREVLDKEGGK